MAPRSKTPLPSQLRKELERRLAARTFTHGGELAQWLAEQGWSLEPNVPLMRPRFEQHLENVKAATEQARAMVDAAPDDDNRLNEALQRLIQQRLFEILVATEVKDLKRVNLSVLARTVAELGRAWVTQKKWLAETRAHVAQKVTAAEAKVSEVARSAGLTPETEQRIRDALLEIQV